MPLPHAIGDVVEEATGKHHRSDPVLSDTGGPAGNARLTAWTGLLFLVLIIAELITVLDVRGLISWHIVVGAFLVPVALLKTGTTTWRAIRYYTGHASYVQAGPPPTMLRFLGPLVVLTTLGLLGSGVALIVLGPTRGRQPFVTLLGQSIDMLTLHQALFIAFGVATGVHLLARMFPAVALVTGRIARATAIPGRSRRITSIAAALVAAAISGVLLLGASSGWQHDNFHDHHRGPGAAVGGR